MFVTSPLEPSHFKCAQESIIKKTIPTPLRISLQPRLWLPLHSQISRKHSLSIIFISLSLLPTHSPAPSCLPSGPTNLPQQVY